MSVRVSSDENKEKKEALTFTLLFRKPSARYLIPESPILLRPRSRTVSVYQKVWMESKDMQNIEIHSPWYSEKH
jgi:hypothetical protein